MYPFKKLCVRLYGAYMSQVTKEINAGQDDLNRIFKRIEDFFPRLVIVTKVPATEEMMDKIVKLLVEVLSVLGIVTKEIKSGRSSKYLS